MCAPGGAQLWEVVATTFPSLVLNTTILPAKIHSCHATDVPCCHSTNLVLISIHISSTISHYKPTRFVLCIICCAVFPSIWDNCSSYHTRVSTCGVIIPDWQLVPGKQRNLNLTWRDMSEIRRLRHATSIPYRLDLLKWWRGNWDMNDRTGRRNGGIRGYPASSTTFPEQGDWCDCFLHDDAVIAVCTQGCQNSCLTCLLFARLTISVSSPSC